MDIYIYIVPYIWEASAGYMELFVLPSRVLISNQQVNNAIIVWQAFPTWGEVLALEANQLCWLSISLSVATCNIAANVQRATPTQNVPLEACNVQLDGSSTLSFRVASAQLLLQRFRWVEPHSSTRYQIVRKLSYPEGGGSDLRYSCGAFPVWYFCACLLFAIYLYNIQIW